MMIKKVHLRHIWVIKGSNDLEIGQEKVYTEDNLRKMGLNERQIKAVMYVKEKGKITNREYTKEFSVSRDTSTRDLIKLVKLILFKSQGKSKRNVYYILI